MCGFSFVVPCQSSGGGFPSDGALYHPAFLVNSNELLGCLCDRLLCCYHLHGTALFHTVFKPATKVSVSSDGGKFLQQSPVPRGIPPPFTSGSAGMPVGSKPPYIPQIAGA